MFVPSTGVAGVRQVPRVSDGVPLAVALMVERALGAASRWAPWQGGAG